MVSEYLIAHSTLSMYQSITTPTEKLRGEAPGEQLPPIVRRAHFGGLFKDAGRISLTRWLIDRIRQF